MHTLGLKEYQEYKEINGAGLSNYQGWVVLAVCEHEIADTRQGTHADRRVSTRSPVYLIGRPVNETMEALQQEVVEATKQAREAEKHEKEAGRLLSIAQTQFRDMRERFACEKKAKEMSIQTNRALRADIQGLRECNDTLMEEQQIAKVHFGQKAWEEMKKKCPRETD